MTPNLNVYPNLPALTAAALEIVVERILTSIDERNSCFIALAGGMTPQPLYSAIAHQQLPWEKIQIFWNDERYVPQNHHDNNYGNVKHVLLDHIPIPPNNIHPIPIDLTPPDVVANHYEHEIRKNLRHNATWFGQ
jgi:6-phosphogluconolactonase